ncbi:MAG: alsR [Paenibacillaceae bacterium]|jgi:DNA-binding transcriptional LysR family regulator|nr:alsR [Paenibacillaceae bacterium]
MNLKQLEYFVAVAEALNFTKAARKFYISQTAITKQIMALEARLDAKLFIRTKQRVELTPAGFVFLQESRSILNRAEEAVERVHLAAGGIAGSLNIGFVKGYEKTSFSSLILDFHKEYPHVFMSFTRNNSEELYQAVEDRDLDIVFNISSGPGKNGELEQRTVRKYPLVAVVYPAHPLASRDSLQLDELKNEELLLMDASFRETNSTGVRIKDLLANQSMPRIIQQSRDAESILLMVSANMGVALLPTYAVKYLNHSRHLKIIPLEDEGERVEIAAFWSKNNHNPVLGMFLRKLEAFQQQKSSGGL